jgi:hypothetical protein
MLNIYFSPKCKTCIEFNADFISFEIIGEMHPTKLFFVRL